MTPMTALKQHATSLGRDWPGLLMISFVAAMIWLFAEAASLSRAPELARIIIADPLDQNIVRVTSDGWTGSVRLTLEGPTSSLQRASSLLAEGVRLALGQPGVPNVEGEHVVDLRQALRADERISRAGLTVIEADPATVRIEVESFVELPDVEVTLDAPGLLLSQDPVFDPPRVRVRARRAVIRELESLPGGPVVVATLPPASTESLVPGAARSLETRLALPGAITSVRDPQSVRITPSSAQVTLTARSRIDSITIPSAPIWTMMPPTEADLWSVTVETPFVRDVVLSGPPDLIEQFRQNRLRLVATLAFTNDELSARITSKPVTVWAMSESDRGGARDVPAELAIKGGETPIKITIAPRQQPPAPQQPQQQP